MNSDWNQLKNGIKNRLFTVRLIRIRSARRSRLRHRACQGTLQRRNLWTLNKKFK